MNQLKRINESLWIPVLNRLDAGVAILKSIRNSAGSITGFERLFANKKAHTFFTGSIYVDTDFDEWNVLPGSLKDYREIIYKGIEKKFNAHPPDSPFAGFGVTCSKLDDGILMVIEDQLRKKNTGRQHPTRVLKHSNSKEIETVFSLVCDVAELHKTEGELKTNALLENVINTSGNAITVFNPVYNNNGNIEDFEYFMVNETQLKLFDGRNLVGRRYTILNAPAGEPGVLEAMKQVMSTGLPADLENLKEINETKDWFRHRIYKIGNMLMRATENITERKKIEEELKQAVKALEKKESFLREAERIGNMGSWEKNILTGELCWSDQLYAIYGLNPDNIKPSVDFWMEHIVHPEDKKIVQKQMNKLYKDGRALVAEYRIVRPNGSVRCVYSEPELKFDGHKKPVLAIGVVIDITETKKLEKQAQGQRLKQQNEVLHAILTAQEEERRRIAEALHNDLGQMLYMIKIKQRTDKKLAEQMLDAAIHKARTISFDLMPSILLDYGLDVALKDLIKNLSAQGIAVSYANTLPHKRLATELEICIFRILQELVNNIIKHSKANKASIAICYTRNSMQIETTDNGDGFKDNEQGARKKGFGLRNISNRLQLYSGSIIIKPAAVKGTCTLIDLKIQ